MKSTPLISLLLVAFLTSSCASLTGRIDAVERDEFLYKLPMLNEQILGTLISDDPGLNLEALSVKDYVELFDRIELTSDDQEVVTLLRKDIPEQKFLPRRNTFLVCLRSEPRQFILCDDAATPGADRIVVEKPIPPLESFYLEFIRGAQQ